MLKKLPLPIVGLMLGLTALGNLLLSYGEKFQIIFYILSFTIFIMVTLKIVSKIEGFKEELKNPVTASVFPTYSMTMMLYGGFLLKYNPTLANIFWYFGVILHIILIIYFTVNFGKNYKNIIVFPSWFIVYVGIVVSSVTGKNFNQNVGKVAFVFGLISFFVVVILAIKNIRTKEFPEPTKPLLTIMTAPASLCVAGYISIFDEKNIYFLITLLTIAQLLYIYVIIKLSSLLKLKFYPSYSGFTFPLVISAIGLKMSTNFLESIGFNVSILRNAVLIETIIALLMVLYVLVRYIGFLIPKPYKLKVKENS